MSNVQLYYFEGMDVRVVVKDGSLLWALADIGRALGFGNIHSSVNKLPESEKVLHILDTHGGKQEMLMVTEPGLYRLIFRSIKPSAQRFQNWVFTDVLPSIREKGSYQLPNEYLDATQNVFNGITALLEDQSSSIEELRTIVYEQKKTIDALLSILPACSGLSIQRRNKIAKEIGRVKEGDSVSLSNGEVKSKRSRLNDLVSQISYQSGISRQKIYQGCYDVLMLLGIDVYALKTDEDTNYLDVLERTKNLDVAIENLEGILQEKNWENLREALLSENELDYYEKQ